MHRFKNIAKLHGFTGTITPGQHAHSDVETTTESDAEDDEDPTQSHPDTEDIELDEDEVADEEDEAIGQALHSVIQVSIDS